MQDILDGALKKSEKFGADYIELRGEQAHLTNIELKEGSISTLSTRDEIGIAIRVLAGGAWGFSSISGTNGLIDAIEEAYRLAVSASKSRTNKIDIATPEVNVDRVKKNYKIDPAGVNIEDKLSRMFDVNNALKSQEKRITAASVKYKDGQGKKYIQTSAGTKLEIDTGFIWNYVWVTGKENGRLTSVRDEIGTVDAGMEFFNVETPEEIAKRTLGKLQLQLKAVTPKGGSFPCVMAPRIVGVLAHEALGHLSEADLMVNSAFSELIGKDIAPSFVSMSDDGNTPDGFGNIIYDEEGTKARKIEIIKNGKLNGLLTNLEYSKRTGFPLSGSARAEDFRSPPIIRMRNTYFERGDAAHEELFEGIEFGYYCKDVRGGQAELDSSFQLGVQECFEIVNGELANPVRDLSIGGIAVDSLKQVQAVGKDFGSDSGRCGKGQTAFIGAGGPHIRLAKGAITFGGRS